MKNNENRNYENFEFDDSLFKLLSESIRLDILKLLAFKGEMDITTISQHFQQDRSVISRHLKKMYEEGILIKTKDSRHVMYQVDGLAFLRKIQKVESDVKEILALCCSDLFYELYDKGMTYKDYLKQSSEPKEIL